MGKIVFTSPAAALINEFAALHGRSKEKRRVVFFACFTFIAAVAEI